MHSRWLKTRRHFYESLRQEIQLFTGSVSEDIQDYQNEYEKTFDQVWDVSSMDELVSKILKARFVIGGDYHYFYQSQRTHFRVLREVYSKLNTKKLVLMLEVFNFKDQKKIDDFLSGKINFQDLLKKTKWQKTWSNLPIDGYKKILNWAKHNRIQVLGINDSKIDDLKERDIYSASVIDDVFESESLNSVDKVINYVIYGDFHLAQAHLPQKIKNFDLDRDVVLHLNSDKLYFALSEHAIEDKFEVLRLQSEFCILSSTPWVKLQSYLVFLQEMDDQMISEIEDDDLFEPDYTDYLGKILDNYIADFELPNWKNLLDVLIPKDLDFEKLEFLKLKKQDKEKLAYFVTAQKNIVFPKDQIQFLAKPSVNSAYSLVGEFIHAQLSQRESLNWSGDYFMQRRIWLDAVSFFFNLWLNPTVKILNESDLNARLKSLEQKTVFENNLGKEGDYAESVLKFSVDFRLSEIKNITSDFIDPTEMNRPITEAHWTVQLEAAAILGKIMGQKLYKKFKSGLLSRDELIGYLGVPIESDHFIAMYRHLLTQLE